VRVRGTMRSNLGDVLKQATLLGGHLDAPDLHGGA